MRNTGLAMMTKHTRLAALFALAVAASGSEALSQTAEDELRELEQELARAWVGGDRAAIDAIIADDWSVIDISGRVRTKGEVFDDMFGPLGPRITEMIVDDIRVRLFEGWAIVTGRTSATGNDELTVRLRFTDIAVRRDNRWQFVASQGTRILE